MRQTIPQIRKLVSNPGCYIRLDASVAEARKLMLEGQLQHLLVLDNKKLAGVISERDIRMIEAFKQLDLAAISVAEVMTGDACVIAANRTLDEVAQEMTARKCGFAVVVDKDQVLGVFTLTECRDALRQLLDKRSSD